MQRRRWTSALAWVAAAAPAAIAQSNPSHWAYQPPREVAIPLPDGEGWARSPIDAFVLDRMERDGHVPAAEADARTLVRRLAFDLTGLPASPGQVDAVAADPTGSAFVALVDELLASPQFAERMAMHWLDLVRFADTTGVHADNPWDIHPYRDWVIRAFLDNMPFDRFTREQLAGDLIPDADTSQRVAAAYNRLNLITREGGSQPKEFLARYTADRVRNLSTVWLGSTVGCAECHDHKFDPIRTRDFYRLGAFFADIEQVGVYSQGAPKDRYFGPYVKVPTAEQERALDALADRAAAARLILDTQTPELDAAQAAWERATLAEPPLPPRLGPWHAAGPFRGKSLSDVHRQRFWPEDGVDLEASVDGAPAWTPHPEWTDGVPHNLSGGNSAYYLFRTIDVVRPQRVTLRFGSDDAIRVWVDGELLLDREVQRGVAPDQERVDVELAPGRHQLVAKISNGAGGFAFFFRSEADHVPEDILDRLTTAADARSQADRDAVSTWFRSTTPLLEAARLQLASLETERAALEDQVAVCMATVSTEPMTTRVLRRGDWMDESGEVVSPGVPAAFGALPTTDGRPTRLDLADWLLADDHPLVARVFVNRLWRLFFGRGIVATLDDFGTQGARPTHPELLDWLARRFVESGWDVRAMVRLLVTSSTYRQSSSCSPETARSDPYNEWFARQARFRVDAEVVRDQALAVSGLLVPELFGRSVRPYQPEGFYQHLNFPRRRYEQDAGEALWRRSLYTHWQRQYLHPALAAFDAPSREECTVERGRSNTPLQALVLLNDPILVEAARALGARAMREGGTDVTSRISFLFRTVLARTPTDEEAAVLTEHVARLLAQYANDRPAADALLDVGEREVYSDLDPAELAAWTGAGRVMLSLHETLTRS
ncbi:MAG: DUF1549 and DUF1553 domain-containing protein [Planctomycetota bacterium]|nr:DUF1549 and DUF1553 domain-containing protein [Planctomycetota bacterium]